LIKFFLSRISSYGELIGGDTKVYIKLFNKAELS